MKILALIFGLGWAASMQNKAIRKELLISSGGSEYYPMPLECPLRLSYREMIERGLEFGILLGAPISDLPLYVASSKPLDLDNLDERIEKETLQMREGETVILLARTPSSLDEREHVLATLSTKPGPITFSKFKIIREGTFEWHLEARLLGLECDLGFVFNETHVSNLYLATRNLPGMKFAFISPVKPDSKSYALICETNMKFDSPNCLDNFRFAV